MARGEKTFRAGSVIVKEKLAGEPHGDADGVAFMVKRNSQAFVSTGGWEFLYVRPLRSATHASIVRDLSQNCRGPGLRLRDIPSLSAQPRRTTGCN